MPALTDLPDELLAQIANHLNDGKPSYTLKALCWLSQASRRLCRIAQEVLYHAPHLGDIRCLKQRPFQTAKLVRTLLSRPDLARTVQSIKLVVIVGEQLSQIYWVHENDPYDNCRRRRERTKERLEIIEPAIDYIMNQPYGNDNWAGQLRNKFGPAWAGLLLTFLPNLQHLSIKAYDHAPGCDWDYVHLVSDYMDPKEWFGLGKFQIPVATLPAFLSLKTITTTGLLPWSVITIPTLREIHIHLWSRDFTKIPAVVRVPRFATLNNIKTLAVDMRDDVFENRKNLKYGAFRYFSNLVKCLSTLESLTVEVDCSRWNRYDMNHDPRRHGFFANLTNMIQHDSLRQLTIKARSVPCEACYLFRGKRTYELNISTYTRIDPPIDPCASLQHLANLRFLEVPQDLLFSIGPRPRPCILPATLEELHIFNSTMAVRRWIVHLSREKTTIAPSLKRLFTSDCDREDIRLDPIHWVKCNAVGDISEKTVARKMPWKKDWELVPGPMDLQPLLKQVGIEWEWTSYEGRVSSHYIRDQVEVTEVCTSMLAWRLG